MAFVNEYASKEDVAKYRLDEMQRKHCDANPLYNWTIDRERDVFLMYATAGSYGGGGLQYMLSRLGKLTFHWLSFHADTETRTITWTYLRVAAPKILSEEVQREVDATYADLKAALRTYKATGALKNEYNNYETVVFVDF